MLFIYLLYTAVYKRVESMPGLRATTERCG